MSFEKLIGKTIERVTEGYEDSEGVRVWTIRAHFSDGTSAGFVIERDDWGDRRISIEFKERS